ncbi:MAG: tetratricopeptide repeat protein [Phycisphaerales bacterium]
MTEHEHNDLRRLFDLAIAAAPADRGPLLDRECKGDAGLKKRVEAMVAAAEDERFMSAPTLDLRGRPASPDAADAATLASSREGPGTRIGPYKLLQLIGEGGFGSVFMAEQEKPVQRRVALKVIKLGMDTRQVVARFEQERQALAMMEHPNIARVLDAGATETGRPFFVMELVKGEPIVAYCDRNNLSVQERLELFAQVCNAVQHAHTKGIIHRDIKPSNILVSTQDGRPHTKVIDFGIAKATASKLTEKTLFTEHKALIGTPEYMSPEQAEGNLDIDTRTDVYSLGVLLYELLTGTTPFEGTALRSAAYAEIQRIIREVEPPRPSTRLSNNTDTIGSVAAQRRSEPRKLGTLVRGELDWIVMKALEKDRQRRYETASGLGMDIMRYLGGEAVLAAPPSTAYRFKKFIRRNRSVVLAGSAVAAALLIGVVAFAWQAKIAGEQRDLAIEAQHAADTQRDRAVKAEGETSKRAAELKLVADFQADMLARIDPVLAGLQLSADIRAQFIASLGAPEGARTEASIPEAERAAELAAFDRQWARINAADAARNLIDRTVLKPAVASIDAKFKGQPLVDASLRQSVASVYRGLGLFDAALPLLRTALDTRKRVLGEDNPDTLASTNNMGLLFEYQGDLARAEPYLRDSLERFRRVLGNDHRDTLSAINNLGYLLEDLGKLAEAEPLYREALEGRRRVLGNDDSDTLISVNNLGFLLMSQSKPAEAEPYLREAYESRKRVLGEDDPETLVPLNNLGLVLQQQGKLSEAEPFYRKSLAKRRQLLGEEHPQTLTALHNMGFLLSAQGNLAESESHYRDVLEKRRRLLGDRHPHTLASINGLASVLRAQGKLAEAEPLAREVLTSLRTTVGEEHLNTLSSMMNLGALLQAQGKLSEAEPFLREATDKSRRALGDEHQVTLKAIAAMGKLRFDQNRLPEAEAFDVEALEKRRRVMGDSHPDTLNSVVALGELRVAQKNFADALTLLTAIEPQAKLAFTGGNATTYANLLRNLGAARTALAKNPADFIAAEDQLLRAHGIYLASRGEQHKDTRATAQQLVEFYLAWDKAEPGKGHDSKATQWTTRLEHPSPDPKDAANQTPPTQPK